MIGRAPLAVLSPLLLLVVACSDSSAPPAPPLPPPVEPGFGAVTIAADRTCALFGTEAAGSDLYCWGGGYDGDDPITPRPTLQPRAEKIVRVAGQGRLVCAVGVSATVYCAGRFAADNTTRRLDPGDIDASGLGGLTVGMGHACGLASDSTVACFGTLVAGKLGRLWDTAGPDSVRYDWEAKSIGSSLRFRQLALGYTHTCGIASDRTVACLGDSLSVGNPGSPFLREMNPCWSHTMPCTITPVAVPGLTNVVAIAAGQSHTCAVASEGTFCWGSNFAGQLGTPAVPNSPLPMAVTLPSPATLIASGGSFTCALAQDGKVYCWGTPAGELQQQAPAVVPGGYPRFTQLAVGDGHACGLHQGEIYCWGKNGRFLGNGDSTGVATFTRVVPPAS